MSSALKTTEQMIAMGRSYGLFIEEVSIDADHHEFRITRNRESGVMFLFQGAPDRCGDFLEGFKCALTGW